MPHVRSLLASRQGNVNALLDCFESIDVTEPLRCADPAVIATLHEELVQVVATEIIQKCGDNWTKLYFMAMQLSDLDFCFKLFMQQLLDTADAVFKKSPHTENAATLAQASVASDIRVSAFNDVLERSKEITEEQEAECLPAEEARQAIAACTLHDVLVFDINTSNCFNLLQPLVPALEQRGKRCRVYKLVQDFVTDFAGIALLKNKVVYVVFSLYLDKLEYDRMLNVFVQESITPIVIIYTPNSLSCEIAKSMFKYKWIITTLYAERFEDIADYVSDTEINISKEMMYYGKVYSDFAKTMKSIEGKGDEELSRPDNVEYDAGFEIMTEINSGVFSQLVEELSLGTKLIGSLHFYMWKKFKEQGKQDVYWSSYAPLFGITPKTMNILDVNFGKNILRAYTLQVKPPFYYMLNDAFRGGNPEKIAKFRGFYVMLHDLIKKGILKFYAGCVFRGTFFNPKVLASIKPGQQFFSTCFTSTSKSPYVARDFARKTSRNVLLEIELDPNGHSNVDIHREGVSIYPEEQEVLLLPFTSFVIQSLTQEEKLTVIHMKEVLQEIDVAKLKGIDYYN